MIAHSEFNRVWLIGYEAGRKDCADEIERLRAALQAVTATEAHFTGPGGGFIVPVPVMEFAKRALEQPTEPRTVRRWSDAKGAYEYVEQTEAYGTSPAKHGLEEQKRDNEKRRRELEQTEAPKDIGLQCKCGWKGRHRELVDVAKGKQCPKCASLFLSYPEQSSEKESS